MELVLSSRIYFDHSATTPLDPRVLEGTGPFLGGAYGNPSSLHQEGRVARAAVDKARAQVAELVGAEPEEIIFTASGTEADNLALIGAVRASGKPGHVVTTSIEHAAFLRPVSFSHVAAPRSRIYRSIAMAWLVPTDCCALCNRTSLSCP